MDSDTVLATGKTMKKNKTSLFALAFIGLLTLFLHGCATTGTDSSVDTLDEELIQDAQYTVKRGDLLGDIAIATTGKISNWRTIATYNGITDPRKLKVGTILLIPARLLTENDIADTSSSKSRSIAAASDSSTQGSIPTTNALAVVQSSVDAEDNLAEVVIEPVAINRSFDLNPIKKSDLNTQASSESGPEVPRIRVIGTYYPKGIYKQPASYSTLMMRVAPGSLFELEREVNDWYKVITSQGVGYLRAVDGVIVESE